MNLLQTFYLLLCLADGEATLQYVCSQHIYLEAIEFGAQYTRTHEKPSANTASVRERQTPSSQQYKLASKLQVLIKFFKGFVTLLLLVGQLPRRDPTPSAS